MRYFFLFLLGLAGFASAATADVLVNYRNLHDGSTIKVETADNGNARIQYSNQPFYLIVRGGEDFVIYTITADPRVVRVADLKTVYDETPPSIRIETPALDKYTIAPSGNATYSGVTGKAYSLVTPYGKSPRPILVVTHDAKLQPVGAALTRQLNFSFLTLKQAGQPIPPTMQRIREYIGDGTPILFAGYKIDSVSTAKVDEREFELPAEPLSLELLRQNARAAVAARQ